MCVVGKRFDESFAADAERRHFAGGNPIIISATQVTAKTGRQAPIQLLESRIVFPAGPGQQFLIGEGCGREFDLGMERRAKREVAR